MGTILLIFFLSVESSYVQNVERHAEAFWDTIQFVLLHGQAWRIKTYAVDRDVHVWSLGSMSRGELEKLAHANTKKHYGDVLGRVVAVEGVEDSVASLKAGLGASGLAQHLESPNDGAFAFWVPEPGAYRTKSVPQ